MDLSGQLLIAMPGMGDPRFERSVIFMCAHSSSNALGLIVNQPAPELTFTELMAQVQIKIDAPQPKEVGKLPIHIGGPVEHGRGFVLHSTDYRKNESTLHVNNAFGMTATLDILQDIASGQGPRQCILALGYSGWGEGQLENEIKRNGWLTAEATPDLVFDDDNPTKWERALGTLGIDPVMLSGSAGHA